MIRDHERALRVALAYRDMGLTPLPSRSDDKRPAMASYHEFRHKTPPDSLYSRANWQSCNIQLMTGVATPSPLKVLVVDIDGSLAMGAWKLMCARYGEPSGHWLTFTPSGGRHLYFSVPEGVPSVPTRMIWGLWDTWGRGGKGSWVPHNEIKVLGDGALVVAPPSMHVKIPSSRYIFDDDARPTSIKVPSEAPGWLLAMPGVSAIGSAQPNTPMPRGERLGQSELDSIQDRLSPDQKSRIAQGWGLRLAGRNGDNWIHCHRADQDDATPSAGFHAPTGRYKDHVSGEVLTFFQLGVRLGAFRSVYECAKWCSYHAVQRALAH